MVEEYDQIMKECGHQCILVRLYIRSEQEEIARAMKERSQ